MRTSYMTCYEISKDYYAEDIAGWFSCCKDWDKVDVQEIINTLAEKVNEKLPGSYSWQPGTSTIYYDTDEDIDLTLDDFNDIVEPISTEVLNQYVVDHPEIKWD